MDAQLFKCGDLHCRVHQVRTYVQAPLVQLRCILVQIQFRPCYYVASNSLLVLSCTAMHAGSSLAANPHIEKKPLVHKSAQEAFVHH